MPQYKQKKKKAEEEARQREAERVAAEQRRKAELEAQGLVDLGLSSGILWKNKNEDGGFYTYEQALNKFGNKLPTKEQFAELKNECQWSWLGNGYRVTGPNGNSIVLPAAGYHGCNPFVYGVGYHGDYWSSSSTGDGTNTYWYLYIDSGKVDIDGHDRCRGQSVRLVQD